MSNHAELTAEALHSAAIESSEMNLIALLKPKICIDGNQWCVLYGDNIQDGVCGFGDTPRLAVYAFNKAWDTALGSGDGKDAKRDPEPNWCRTCGKHTNDPDAMFCSNPCHLSGEGK